MNLAIYIQRYIREEKKRKLMNMYSWIIWSGQGMYACYHDREQHLRRDDNRPQGTAVREGIARYGHQGGGQRQAGQGNVI